MQTMDTISIKINNQEIDLDKSKLKVSLDVLLSLSELEKDQYYRGKEGLESYIMKTVAKNISNEFLEKYSEKIIDQIDVNEIIKRVKLGIIQNVAGR